MIENERSFLVERPPDLSGASSKEIEQHYLSDERTPLRIRAAGGRFELTKKIPLSEGDLSRHEEITIPLSSGEYGMLAALAKRSVRKTRHMLPLPGGLTAEIDVFHGPLEGLIMAEVEFPDEKTRESFAPPPWFGRDVSQEAWSTNAYLAGRTYAEIEPLIRRRKN
jgi:CYTH domain-containing protein